MTSAIASDPPQTVVTDYAFSKIRTVIPSALSGKRRAGLIVARLDEFKQLNDGWLDGKGIAPASEKLDWLANAFQDNYPEELPPPYFYPTAEGGVQAEWSVGKWEITLEVDFDSAQGEWHALHMMGKTEEVKTLDLNVPDDWRWIAAEIARRLGGE